jgi:hypothetical protein
MADELHAEPALNTEIAVIRDAADRTGHANDLICFWIDVKVNLATDTTIRTGCSRTEEIFALAFALGSPFIQGSGRACGDTLAAELTGGFVQWNIEGGSNFNTCSPVFEGQSTVHLHFFAYPYAPAATNAFVQIIFHSFITGCIVLLCRADGGSLEYVIIELIFIGITLEFTVPIFITGRTYTPMLIKQQLQYGLA